MSAVFLVTALIIVATPGTGALFTISAGLSRGARASMVAAFGCTLGIVPHLAAAVTGTAALLRASGVAFVVFAAYGVGAAQVRRHLVERPRVVRQVRQLFAASFVALGARLALTDVGHTS